MSRDVPKNDIKQKKKGNEKDKRKEKKGQQL